MKEVKQTAEYSILQKKSGRYAVRGKDKKWVNGDEKAQILLAEQLIKPPMSKAPVAEPEPEAAAEAAAEGDAPAA